MIISILIATLDERAGMLASLLDELTDQIEECNATKEVEVLTEMDNRQITTGAKRNILMQRAKGKYVVYVDDDDKVAPYYIEELLKAAESDADCFAINGVMLTNNTNEKKWYISKNNPYMATRDDEGNEIYLRYPNHITPIRSSIAKQFLFPDLTIAEDFAWATAIHNAEAIKTEFKIDRPMYIYKYVTK